jgi:hypothetical protein
MNRWLSTVGVGVFRLTATRRGALGWLGRASTGLAAAGIALAGVGTAQAAEPDARPAPPQPRLLPRGERAAALRGCGSCSGAAEYVCADCCVGSTCCSGSLYRQPCYDSRCRLYYTYWCA